MAYLFNQRRLGRVLLTLLLALVPAPSVLAVANPPNGFGKVRLGMSVDEVKRIFPNMEPVGNPTPESAALLLPFRVQNQSAFGFKSCEVTLYFDPSRLYQIGFNCGEAPSILDVLTKRFGKPTQIVSNNAYWYGSQTAISLNTKSRHFAVIDRELNDGMQQRLNAYVLAHQSADNVLQPPATPPVPAPAAWFTERRWPAGGSHPFGVAAADFNSDGRPDLAISFADDHVISLLLANGAGGFDQGPRWPAVQVTRGLVASDLNHDGHMDLVVAGVHSGSVIVYLGDGHAGATSVPYPTAFAPFNVAVADLNGDGSLDIAVANESNLPALRGKGDVSVLLNDGTGAFPRRVGLTANSYPADVQAGDFNGDGKLDLAVVNWDSHDLSLFPGHGDGTFAAEPPIPVSTVPAYTLAVGKLDHDSLPDIVVGDVVGRVYVLRNSDGKFTVQPPLFAGGGLRCLILADMNGDGLLDIVTANVADGTVSILLAEPGGGFSRTYNVTVGPKPRVVTAVDLNGDKKLDLVVTNGDSDDVSVLMNNGVRE